MAYATIVVRSFIFLSPGRLITKVGRDVTDGHFIYIYSAIFRHQTDLFYCAQDIGAVVCPFIYHYATHTANGFRAVRHLWNHCAAERTCRYVSRWSGAYFIPIRSMFGRVGCIAHIVTSIIRERDV